MNSSPHHDSDLDQPIVRPRSSPWFDKYDRAGLNVLLAVVPVVTIIATIGGSLRTWAAGKSLVLPQAISNINDAVIADLDKAHVGYQNATVDAVIAAPTAADRLVAMAPGVVLSVVIGVACYLVFRVVDNVANGRAFIPSNIKRLRVLSLFIAVGPAAYSMARAFVMTVVLPGYGPQQLFGPTVYVWVLVGISVAGLSQAFSVGQQLGDDVAATV